MKVAVLGTGSAGSRHLRALELVPGVEPMAVPVRSSRLSELKEKGVTVAESLPEAAANGAKAAVVATDTTRHADDVLSALDEGLDVLVEKPMATNSTQAQQICERAMQLEQKVYVGCVLRFSESLKKFRELLPQVGPLHSVRIEAQSYLPDWRPQRSYQQSYSARSGEGGVLLDLIHDVDYAGWIFGWPATVQGNVSNLGKLGIESEEVADVYWETAEQCTVSVHLDYLSRPPRRKMRAYGENGSIEWDGIGNSVKVLTESGPPTESGSQQSLDDMFQAQDKAWINALKGNSDPRLATADEGAKALAVCDAVRRSSETRKEQKVEHL